MRPTHSIAVLMGGVSNEREVSFRSGAAIAQALKKLGHRVYPVDIKARSVDQLDQAPPELAFIALHGEFGEDGGIQALLEKKGIPYTGSGPETSRIGMDKVASKRRFIRHSVPTADYLVVGAGMSPVRASEMARSLGYPLVGKPARGGSSLGVRIVRSPFELPAALREASLAQGPENAGQVMLERYVKGRELTVGVLDGEPLPTIEVVPGRAFFDYEAKYKDEQTCYVLPCALLHSIYRKTQEAAVRAFEALGCRHMARVDMIYGYDGGLYVLEVNTIPGFTPRSLLPMAARHAGIEFPELCGRIVEMALRDAAATEAETRRIA